MTVTKTHHLTMFLVVGFMLLLATAATVRADPVVFTASGQSVTQGYQSVSLVNTNATVQFTFNGNTMTVTMTNTSTEPGDGSNLFALAFNSTPDLVITNFVASGAASGWTQTNGGGNFEFAATGGGNGVIRQCNFGSCVGEFTITFSTTISQLTLDTTQIHFNSLGAGDNGSEKDTGTTIPEPASMLLLGTGLLGTAMAVRRKRQKRT